MTDEDPIDVMLVGINPLIRDDLPLTAWQIIDRDNEISLTPSLMQSRFVPNLDQGRSRYFEMVEKIRPRR